MRDGGLERAFHCCALLVHVNPLVVEGGIGKLADALLAKFHIIGHADVLAEKSGKLMIAVDNYFTHCFIVFY